MKPVFAVPFLLFNNICNGQLINAIAGTGGVTGYAGDGGQAINAKFNYPAGVSVDNNGNIYVTDHFNYVIRKISPAGIISTIAGNGTQGYTGDGNPAVSAQLNGPVSSVIYNGELFFTDSYNHVIRKITKCLTTVNSAISISFSSASACENAALRFTAIPQNGGNNPFFQWKVNGRNAGTNGNIFNTNALVNGDISVSHGSSVQLIASATGIVLNYLWTPSLGLNNTAISNPVATPAITTAYQLEVTSDKGCKGVGVVRVTVLSGFYMPTAFTPNNDGLNDIFRIPPGSSLLLKRFSIYNRWGQQVFATRNINNGWDGKYKGTRIENGIYVYLITGKYQSQEVAVKGSFTLIR